MGKGGRGKAACVRLEGRGEARDTGGEDGGGWRGSARAGGEFAVTLVKG